MVATAVLFSSAFPGMFNTFVRWQFQRTYDAMLAAPVDVEELITAEMLWISLRAGVYGLAPLLVGFAFGLQPECGDAARAADRLRHRLRLRRLRRDVAAVAKTIDNFNYVTSAVLTPMFLVAGTFFPISSLPRGAAHVAQFNPLYHCVQLVRDASLGDPARWRPRPRGGAARVRAADVAPGDLAARPAPDRLARALTKLSGSSDARSYDARGDAAAPMSFSTGQTRAHRGGAVPARSLADRSPVTGAVWAPPASACAVAPRGRCARRRARSWSR